MGLFDSLTSAATTASNQVKNVVANTGLASNLSGISNNIADLQKAVSNGLTNVGSNLLSSVAGQSSNVFTALQQSLSSIINLGNISNAIKAMTTTVNVPVTLPMTNVLHSYASYNYIFTLSVLDPASINFPDETYKKGNVGQIILKTGAGDPENRVKTAYGKFDFFLDNLVIGGAVGFDKTTGNTNALKIAFKVTEPYSMGLFFQSLQIAARNAGYKNYIDVPLLLTIEFKGHLNSVDQGVPANALSIERTTKHFPLKLLKVDMKVSGKGAEYDISAYPWNEKGFSSSYLDLKSDISISGKTVHEMLQTGKESLQVALNKRLQSQKDKGIVKVPDQILIMFPADLKTGDPSAAANTSDTATVNPNQTSSKSFDLNSRLGIKIKEDGNGTLVQEVEAINSLGKASMGFDLYRPGDPPFAKENATYDEKTGIYVRGNISIDPKEGNFKFSQGTDIINAINQVLLMSDYGRQALKSTQISDSGKITWWRIETQLFNIPSDANFAKTGVTPKLIVYRVVPYGIDSSRFLPTNAANPKAEKAKTQAVKEYNYIYTGKNLDIINFDIQFKAGFYNALSADAGKNNEGTQRAKETGTAVPVSESKSSAPAPGNSNVLPGSLPVETRSDQTNLNSGTGTVGGDTPETMAAKEFQNMVVNNGADMIVTTLTILGDPYYLGDSGIGNYTAAASQYENLNSDYSIDYQTGEVDIIVKFRTPIDIDMSKNAYTFGPTELISEFSGLYQVQQVESNFSRGKFTQVLTLNRRLGQTTDKEAIAAANAAPALAKGTDDVIPAAYDDNQVMVAYDDDGNLMPGYELNESNDPVWVGSGNSTGTELRTQSEIQASRDLEGFDG